MSFLFGIFRNGRMVPKIIFIFVYDKKNKWYMKDIKRNRDKISKEFFNGEYNLEIRGLFL